MSYRIGIDVGGTFTDFLLVKGDGSSSVYKTSTTPEDPAIGLLNGLEVMAQDQDSSLQDFVKEVDLIVHGTTVATNAVLTTSGASTGLLTTHGFRDALQMRRGIREAQYDNRFTAPEPLVPRHLRLTSQERMDYRGKVLSVLEKADIVSAAACFREHNVEAVAVCFMHAHANGTHETQAAEILKRELPDLYLSVSSELRPQIRFYDRISTTVLNAYVGPLVKRYLKSLTTRLDKLGFQGVLLIMQSNGGVGAPEVSMRLAAGTLLSGPAAGPAAGLAFIEPYQREDCITVDMGGTSFDAALLVNRQPIINTEGRINGQLLSVPMLDIHTIGAGGGSIGWIDSGGFLRMGPQSAGALPGPACYGRGGDHPTCTDADLILGYLNPNYFLGGKISLSLERARQAVRTHVAEPLQTSVEEAAAGMFTVINNNMADGIREISVQRGYDPRDFPLVVAGGAGPIHAAVIARELEIPLILVPRASSIFCAAGMLLSDLKHDYVRTYPTALQQFDRETFRGIIASMSEEAHQTLSQERVGEERRQLSFSLDLRYVGQHHEVGVPISQKEVEIPDMEAVAARFHEKHDRMYGYSVPETALELVTVRLTAIGPIDKPLLPRFERQASDSRHAVRDHRSVYGPDKKKFQSVPTYDGDRLSFGNRVTGPALIEQVTTTVFVPDGYTVHCDALGSFALRKQERVAELVAGL